MFESVKALMIIKNPVKIKRIVKRRKVNFLSRTGQCLKMIWKLKLMGGMCSKEGENQSSKLLLMNGEVGRGGLGALI